ncbi:MAG: glycosyltransferase family 39 protein [Deltaproteobacteria bacterium]|nr:glycosyltransferase family 39 protein [Deltaproteobacteria bacterium]
MSNADESGSLNHKPLVGFLRVILLVLALALGALGYHDLFVPRFPWWRWAGELLAGCALLASAFGPVAAPHESRWRRALRWAAGATALAAAAIFLVLQPQAGRELAAGVAALAALAAFTLARWLPFTPADVRALLGDDSVAAPAESSPGSVRIMRAAAAVAAVAVGVLAAYVNSTNHLAAFVLWLASLALLAGAVWPRTGVAAAADSWRHDGGPELSPRTAAVALLLILTLALALRVIALKEVPGLIDPDEGRQGRYAERIWKDGFPDAFGIGWNVFPHLAYMTEYVGVQLLGTSNANLRLSAAVIGVLSLVPVFFWARRWWGNVIALLAVLLLAINRDHISWSRVALNNMQQVLVAGLMLAAFARLLRTRRALDWVWLGYATGLAFHTYHAAKLFPALLAVIALVFAVGMPGFLRRFAAGLPLAALAFLLCFGPLLVTIHQRWEGFYGGTSNRVDLYQLTAAYHAGDIVRVRDYLWTHVAGCLLSFTSVPSEGPTFDPWVAVPFVLGMGWWLWRWRDPRHVVVLVWVLGILVIGGMITDYPPWKARLLGFLPALCVIPAVVAGRARAALWQWSPRHADLVATPLLLAWLAAALYANWHNVFVYVAGLQRGDIMTEICRAIDEAPLPATVYMVGGAVMAEPKVAANDCMIAPNPQRALVNLPDDPLAVPIPPANRGNAVLLVAFRQQELLPLIQHYYPEAHYRIVHEPRGAAMLHVFTVRDDVIHRSRGLRANYRSAVRSWSSAEGCEVFQAPAEAPAADFPLTAVWRGLVWAGAPGAYGFRGTSELLIDDRPAGDRELHLAAGWHAIEVRARLSTPADHVALEWQPPAAADWSAIPRALLHTHPEAHGLLGRYFARPIGELSAEPIAAEPDYTRLEAAVSFDLFSQFDELPPAPFAARPSTLEWAGTVELPEGRSHGLRLEATTPASVFLDGTLVAMTAGGHEPQPVTVELSGVHGRRPILIRSLRPADDNPEFWKLRVLWRTPGGDWTAFVDYRPPAAAAARDHTR